MKKLVIVESPNKVAKIKSYLQSSDNLNDEYEVISSVGHIRELSTTGKYGLGIDLDTMTPKYKIPRKKKSIIDEINSKAKAADLIYLATDPDREGESIAWHIKEIIKDKEKQYKRIVFQEITQEAIEQAIENSIDLNQQLVNSQEARRMLDRIIGFRLSALTKKKIAAKSSGRVKSSTLKLIIDRENEIENFIPEIWFNIEVSYTKEQILKYVDDKLNEVKLPNDEELNKIISKLNPEKFELKSSKESFTKVNPPEPLEMATLLMKSFTNLGYSNAVATSLSQSLYEKGLITYPRTDSKRISSKLFIEQAKNYIEKNTKSSFNLIVEKAKKNSTDQDAHEAIRPVSLENTPKNVSKDLNPRELKLYTLIWKITIQSFMDKSETKTVKYIYENNKYLFLTSTSKVVVLGFKELDEKEDENNWIAPEIISVTKDKIKAIKHSTKPPARYNQSSLIKKLKEEGIGRPSTYSATTSGLLKYNYIKSEKGSLIPTEQGKEVTKLLLSTFADIINEKYTSFLESELDKISIGEINHKDFLINFWSEFSPRLDEADMTVEKKIPEYVGRTCPEDGGELVYKVSRYGEKFIACLNFPTCKYSESLVEKKIEYINEKCPICQNELVLRKAKRTGKSFIGCSTFPKCRYIRNIEPTKES